MHGPFPEGCERRKQRCVAAEGITIGSMYFTHKEEKGVYSITHPRSPDAESTDNTGRGGHRPLGM
jgi:hypothetical protein